MINQVDERALALGLYLGLAILHFVLAALFTTRWTKTKRAGMPNVVFLTGALLFLFFGIGRLLFIRFDFFLTNLWEAYDPTHLWDWKLAMSFQLAGFGVVFYALEQQLLQGRDKRLLFVGFVALCVVMWLAPDIELAQAAMLLVLLLALFIPVGYLYLVVKSAGSVRKKSLLIFVGFVLYFLFTMVASEVAVQMVAGTGITKYALHSVAVGGRMAGAIAIAAGYAVPSAD